VWLVFLFSFPPTIDDAPAATLLSLERVNKQLGRVPNIFRVLLNSLAASQGGPVNHSLRYKPSIREKLTAPG
jgi:hypothetical protein